MEQIEGARIAEARKRGICLVYQLGLYAFHVLMRWSHDANDFC